MVLDGLVLTGLDGPVPYAGAWNRLPQPFSIAGVRCDASAIEPDTDEIAIGEAKTSGDLASAHSRRQLGILGGLANKRSGSLCRLYVAVPRSAAYQLDQALIAVGLIGAPHVIRLHIPDVMLEDTLHVTRQPSARVAAAPTRWY
jgi:hypothetical protein